MDLAAKTNVAYDWASPIAQGVKGKSDPHRMKFLPESAGMCIE